LQQDAITRALCCLVVLSTAGDTTAMGNWGKAAQVTDTARLLLDWGQVCLIEYPNDFESLSEFVMAARHLSMHGT